jgi:hypothetical protein
MTPMPFYFLPPLRKMLLRFSACYFQAAVDSRQLLKKKKKDRFSPFSPGRLILLILMLAVRPHAATLILFR